MALEAGSLLQRSADSMVLGKIEDISYDRGLLNMTLTEEALLIASKVFFCVEKCLDCNRAIKLMSTLLKASIYLDE